ncbi:cache domain-containing sensor histidine kinase [Paenibacillus tepidiphilus]|uniref:cache domain-containing sensor histidine kinase n=1 Tax=Paenibacillus tepidiphilus TaxID=2608683 RepID=UPI00123BC445|nr:sensor histidine kinase [Paenibacillus tepidiphilus]
MKLRWSDLAGLGQGMLAARKWLLAYAIFILLPAGIMLASFFERSSRILEQEAIRSMQLALKQAGMNLTYKLDHIRDSSNAIFMNHVLYDNLAPGDSVTGQLQQIKELRYLAESARVNEDIYRLRLFAAPSRLFAGDRVNLFPLADIEEYPWYPAVLEAGGGLVWTEVYREDYTDAGEKAVFSAARLLRNPESYDEIIGAMVLDIPGELIGEVMSELQFSEEYAPLLLDAGGRQIYGPAERELPGAEAGKLPEALAATIAGTGEGVLQRREDRREVHVVYTTIGTTGWKLVAQVSQREISDRAAGLSQFTSVAALIGITVMFLILVFVLLMFIVKEMQRRVQLILKMMRKEGVGWLEDQRALPGGDFRLLESSVDHLIRRLNNLMEESYQAKIQEREAQLRTLQAQINPHFLYNALDMINWSAIAHGAEDTSQMIESLARYFRLSLNKGRDNVSIEDELDLVRVFLEIQQNRFPSTFTCTIEAEPGLGAYVIPKLTLQPLVENALLHGIRKTKAKQGSIRVTARREDGDIVLSVADDGIGMSPEQAKRLLVEPARDDAAGSAGGSYGLYNVNERIRFFAGNRYGLSIETEPGRGTVVTVRMKAVAVE